MARFLIALMVLMVGSGPALAEEVPSVTICEASYLQSKSTCTVDGSRTDDIWLIRSNILTGAGVLVGGYIQFSDKGIVSVGCKAPTKEPDRISNCPRAVISPGWVNAHEHLKYSHAYPSSKLAAVYEHRDEWRLGKNHKRKIPDPKPISEFNCPLGKLCVLLGLAESPEQTETARAWIELRHLVAGTSVVAGSGSAKGWLDNADSGDQIDLESETFPFASDALAMFGKFTCQADNKDWPTVKNIKPGKAYIAHVGEGTNCVAKNEINAFLADPHLEKASRVSIIHAVSADEAQLSEMASRNISVIWSPRSNAALYGTTLDVPAAKNAGVTIGLGTDWSPTGSFSMLEELACARKLYGDQLSEQTLWEMATKGSSYALGIEEKYGELARGRAASLFMAPLESASDEAALEPERFFGSATKSKAPSMLGVWIRGRLAVANQSFAGAMTCESHRIGDIYIFPEEDQEPVFGKNFRRFYETNKGAPKRSDSMKSRTVQLWGDEAEQASCNLISTAEKR